MKALATAVSLGILFISACTGAAAKHKVAVGPVWPLGTYGLVSFNGQRPPIELSDGTTLEAGSLTLSERRGWGYGPASNGAVRFLMEFQIPKNRWWWRLRRRRCPTYRQD